METIEIIPRYCGPINSANGGYAAGVLAQFIDGPAKVRLKMPPPLQTPLHIEHSGDRAELLSDGHTVASAQAAAFEGEPMPPPNLADATAARERYTGFTQHPYPHCFVCGPDREAGDGLNLFPGKVGDVSACDWQPSHDLLDVMGFVQPEFVWAALDCPGYFGLDLAVGHACLLGEMQVNILSDVPGDKPLITYGWKRGQEGRKYFAGSAIADSEGKIYAHAEQTWISMDN